MNTAERVIRTVLGGISIAIGWGIFQNNWIGIIFNIIGGLAILTVLTGKYPILKSNTPSGTSQNLQAHRETTESSENQPSQPEVQGKEEAPKPPPQQSK